MRKLSWNIYMHSASRVSCVEDKGTDPDHPFQFQQYPLSQTHSSSFACNNTCLCQSDITVYNTSDDLKKKASTRQTQRRPNVRHCLQASLSFPTRFCRKHTCLDTHLPQIQNKKSMMQRMKANWKEMQWIWKLLKGGCLMRIWLSKYQSSIHISLAHLCRGLKEQEDDEVGTRMESDSLWNNSTYVGESCPNPTWTHHLTYMFQ